MRCKHCGHTIESDSKFCRHCGKSVASSTPKAKPAKTNMVGDLFKGGRQVLKGKTLAIALAYAAWVLANIVLWVAACLSDAHANASRYFFPLGWSDYSSYDGFEFVIYTVVLPIVVAVVAWKWDWIKAAVKRDMERLRRKTSE